MVDLARGRVGLSRSAVVRFYEPVAEAIRPREPAFVLAHNAPVLPWLLRDTGHRVVLYAHNDLLRTYSRRESARILDGVAAIVCVGESLAERTRAALPGRLPNGFESCATASIASGSPPPRMARSRHPPPTMHGCASCSWDE